MKNSREIILDFTSLLDVIMLILFFFVIFSQLDVNEASAKLESSKKAYEQKTEDAAREWEAADQARREAEYERDKLQQANALAESVIINGAADFDKALRLKLVLSGARDKWSLSVQFAEQKENETVYNEIGLVPDIRNRSAEEAAADLEQIVIGYGYSKEDAFLCDIMYSSEGVGSKIVKDNTDDMLEIFRRELGYRYLFASTTDLSGMEMDKK